MVKLAVILPVEEISANGEQCLNCLSQPRGQAHFGFEWQFDRGDGFLALVEPGERLGAFRVTYVTDHRWNGRAAEATFKRFTETRWPHSVRDQPSTRERILRAFRLEQLLRSRQILSLQDHDERLVRELKQQLTAARYESLYGVWAQTSDQSVYDLVAPDPHELRPEGDLDVHLVGCHYRWLYPA